jgi:hypothetical protein
MLMFLVFGLRRCLNTVDTQIYRHPKCSKADRDRFLAGGVALKYQSLFVFFCNRHSRFLA